MASLAVYYSNSPHKDSSFTKGGLLHWSILDCACVRAHVHVHLHVVGA